MKRFGKERQQGQSVALLALLDTFNAVDLPAGSWRDRMLYIFQKMRFNYRNFLLLDAHERWTFFGERARWAKGMVIARQTYSPFTSLRKALHRAVDRYVPKAYPGRITLFRPMHTYTQYDISQYGWEGIAAEGMAVHELPVYPGGMLAEPFVQVLAEQLSLYLKALEENEKTT